MSNVTIALLRGINVGGHGTLAMADLRDILERLGATDVATYIQSGNVVFRGDITGAAISDAVKTAKGFRPKCMTPGKDSLAQIVADNPFRGPSLPLRRSISSFSPWPQRRTLRLCSRPMRQRSNSC